MTFALTSTFIGASAQRNGLVRRIPRHVRLSYEVEVIIIRRDRRRELQRRIAVSPKPLAAAMELALVYRSAMIVPMKIRSWRAVVASRLRGRALEPSHYRAIWPLSPCGAARRRFARTASIVAVFSRREKENRSTLIVAAATTFGRRFNASFYPGVEKLGENKH